ncbi:hypothetical protein ATER59S_05807 [Aquamicrobium terrae]
MKNRIRIYQGGQAEAQNPSGIRALANVRLRLDTLRASFDAYAEQLEAWTDQKHHVCFGTWFVERERMFALRADIAREAMLIAVDVQTMAGGSAIFKVIRPPTFHARSDHHRDPYDASTQ